MYAIIANGYEDVVKTQRELNRIKSLYPFPKFAKVLTETAGREWLRRNSRAVYGIYRDKYGDLCKEGGYVSLEYFIAKNKIYANVYISKAGCVKLEPDKSVAVSYSRDVINVVIDDTNLNNDLIIHHVIAIRRLVGLIGKYVDINIIVPDISIYLAIEEYRGTLYQIRGLQSDLSSRLASYGITVKE